MKLKERVDKLVSAIYRPKVIVTMFILGILPQIIEHWLSDASPWRLFLTVAKLSLVGALISWGIRWADRIDRKYRISFFDELEELSRKEEAEARREAEIVKGFRKK
ncbi:MAG: hypothetical protein HY889_01640 [Deltaproteobacteria bacterium]|nr:hypothetical protein [Deltaproteobacteria bacterium]